MEGATQNFTFQRKCLKIFLAILALLVIVIILVTVLVVKLHHTSGKTIPTEPTLPFTNVTSRLTTTSVTATITTTTNSSSPNTTVPPPCDMTSVYHLLGQIEDTRYIPFISKTFNFNIFKYECKFTMRWMIIKYIGTIVCDDVPGDFCSSGCLDRKCSFVEPFKKLFTKMCTQQQVISKKLITECASTIQ